MSTTPAKPSLPGLPTDLDGVGIENLHAGHSLPLVAQPAGPMVDLVAWAGENTAFIEQALVTGGAILFRGFGPGSVDFVQRLADALITARMPYEIAMTPRRLVSDLLYEASLIPPHMHVGLHNECCIQPDWPMKLLFGCVQPAKSGGETPLADSRKVHDRLPPEIRDKFAALGVMYEWNISKPWLAGVFGTQNPSSIEEYCDRNDYPFEWDKEGGIHLRFAAQGTIEHPITAERVWFNHICHFLNSFYPFIDTPSSIPGPIPAIECEKNARRAYYGDGSPIGDREMYEIHNAFIAETVELAWQAGDIVLLDNMLTAHGRNSYAGKRKVLVAMGDPYQRLVTGG